MQKTVKSTRIIDVRCVSDEPGQELGPADSPPQPVQRHRPPQPPRTALTRHAGSHHAHRSVETTDPHHPSPRPPVPRRGSPSDLRRTRQRGPRTGPQDRKSRRVHHHRPLHHPTDPHGAGPPIPPRGTTHPPNRPRSAEPEQHERHLRHRVSRKRGTRSRGWDIAASGTIAISGEPRRPRVPGAGRHALADRRALQAHRPVRTRAPNRHGPPQPRPPQRRMPGRRAVRQARRCRPPRCRRCPHGGRLRRPVGRGSRRGYRPWQHPRRGTHGLVKDLAGLRDLVARTQPLRRYEPAGDESAWSATT